MQPETLKRRLAARRTRAAEIALELIADCEQAASRRISRRNTPAQWNAAAWRRYLRAATTSPRISLLSRLYQDIGSLEKMFR